LIDVTLAAAGGLGPALPQMLRRCGWLSMTLVAYTIIVFNLNRTQGHWVK